MSTDELAAYIDDWASTRSQEILHARERPSSVAPAFLYDLGRRDLDRWTLIGVGNSGVAWMERAIIHTSMILDFRSRQFERRLKQEGTWEKDKVDEDCAALEFSDPSATRLTFNQKKQGIASVTFAAEWLAYLTKLFIRPPREPGGQDASHVSRHDAEFLNHWHPRPGPEVRRMLAQMAHCRPAGALFSTWPSDEWLVCGGRDVCRIRSLCPHCHTRHVTRLVGRINEGPWCESRRRGRHLVMLRVAVATDELNLDKRVLAAEREQRNYGRFVDCADDYAAEPGVEASIHNVDTNQYLGHTLTRHEVDTASRLSQTLTKLARDIGVKGGIRIHQVGPRYRNFLHELVVVGELDARHRSRSAEQAS